MVKHKLNSYYRRAKRLIMESICENYRKMSETCNIGPESADSIKGLLEYRQA